MQNAALLNLSKNTFLQDKNNWQSFDIQWFICFCLKKQPSGGVISDPDPILTPKIASKNF